MALHTKKKRVSDHLEPSRPPAAMAECHSQPSTPIKRKKVNCFFRTGRIFIWNNSFRAQIRQRIHLRASRTLWFLGALSGPKTPGRNGSMPQADSLAHQERVGKVNDFLKTGRIFIWNNLFRAQIRLRIHLRASRTLWLLGAFSGPKTPGCNGSMPQADSLAHQERVGKVNDFLKTGRISIWNNSFRAQIRPRMHLRASRTLWLLGA